MGVLRFSFGTMGSGKSTLALQIHHNLTSSGRKGLLLTRLDRAESRVSSRLGVSVDAIEIAPDVDIVALARRHHPLHFIVCDEAQFYTPTQCEQLATVADQMDIDVYAFGLITDFRGLLFDGTKRLLEIADEKVPMQVEARCWCGARALFNARIVNGTLVREGETVVVGDTETPIEKPLFGDVVTYQLLCRRHYMRGRTS